MNNNIYDYKLTCIINVKNADKYIRETIESVLNQKIKVKILVIDNHSTDKTYEIISQYKDIFYYKTPKSCSLGEARNFSLEKLDTEFVSWLDADDIWEPEFALNSLKLLMEFETIGFISSECYVIDSNSNIIIKTIENKISNISNNNISPVKGRSLAKYFSNLDGPWCSYVFRSKYIKMINGFNINLTYAEDLDFILKIYQLSNFNALYLPLKLSRYRYHNDQQSKIIPVLNQYVEKIGILKLYKKKLKFIEYLNILMHFKFLIFRNKYHNNKDFKSFFISLSLAIYPLNMKDIVYGKLKLYYGYLCQKIH